MDLSILLKGKNNSLGYYNKTISIVFEIGNCGVVRRQQVFRKSRALSEMMARWRIISILQTCFRYYLRSNKKYVLSQFPIHSFRLPKYSYGQFHLKANMTLNRQTNVHFAKDKREHQIIGLIRYIKIRCYFKDWKYKCRSGTANI